MEKDQNFELAESYVQETGVSVFLTGKAGTGKTTFLRHIVDTTTKRCAVVAPTGVAAINAGGVTIHSFFQLPLCPYLPDVKELVTEYQMPERYHSLKKERIKILRTLDLLIIDEISMVRADILDAIDYSLRRYRRNDSPFGGVQLLMIGDLQQLPPIVTENERPYFEKVYQSPFFFNSKAFQRLPYVVVELQKIHRQRDAQFLEILNDVRCGSPSAASLAKLNSRLCPSFEPPEDEKWIRLTTHNFQSDSVNNAKLSLLPTEEKVFDAMVEGEFPENSYPADTKLHLKEGAQVMFVRNDSSGQGRYYNGKIGTVVSIDPEIEVEDDQGQIITVELEKWDNIKYELDPESNEIQNVVNGSFFQYPLRLAWAITIHKSQGLTFDRVIIDAGQAFSFGQVYVALSRCRTLDGIVLSSRITDRCTFSNAEVNSFEKAYTPFETARAALDTCRESFHTELMCEAFNLQRLKRLYYKVNKVYQVNLSNTYPLQASSFKNIGEQTSERNGLKSLEETSQKFQNQIRKIAAAEGTSSGQLAERLSKAAAYFSCQMEPLAEIICPLMLVEIDNKETRKHFKEASVDLLQELRFRIEVFRQIGLEGFDSGHFQKIRIESELSSETSIKPLTKSLLQLVKPEVEVEKEERDIYKENAHPEAIKLLTEWRTAKYKEQNVPAFVILSQKALLGLADRLPENKQEFLKIKGLGKAKWEKYGEELIELLKKMRTVLVFLTLSVLSSCLPDRGPEGFEAPTFGETTVLPGIFDAKVSGSITSSTGVQSVELLLYSGTSYSLSQDVHSRTEAGLGPDGTLTVTLNNLQASSDYYCTFRVSNGKYEIYSSPVHFKTSDAPDYITFEDKAFENYLLSQFDLDADGHISKTEAKKIKSVGICTDSVASLAGIEYFTNLTYLYVPGKENKGVKTSKLNELNLKSNRNLLVVHCENNNLTSLDLSGCPLLEEVYCWNNSLTSLDLSNLKYLRDLRCAQSDFTESGLDISNNTQLRCLYVNETGLSKLDVSNNPNLIELGCWNNYLTELDISNLNNLKKLNCGENYLHDIHIPNPEIITAFSVGDSRITDVDIIREMPLLEDYGGNNLPIYKVPDFSCNPKLTSIHICCGGGAEYLPDSTTFFNQWPDLNGLNVCGYQGTYLSFPVHTDLECLWISDCPNLEELDLSASTSLRFISVFHDTKLKTIYIHPSIDPESIEVDNSEENPCTAVFVRKEE